MNSLDPWRTIVVDPADNVLVPLPRYGHPLYQHVPSWIHYGDGRDGTTRLLFDGAFIGADPDPTGDHMHNIGAELTALSAPGYGYYGPFRPYGYRAFNRYGTVFFGADAPPSPDDAGNDADVTPPVVVPGPMFERRGLTAEVGPLLAPATGGLSVKKYLDDQHVLHVEICVDGKCHSTSMDLAPSISMIMEKLAAWHTAQHATTPPPETVVSTVQKAVGEAENMIVGALVARHVDTVAAGWLGDLASGVLGGIPALIAKKAGIGGKVVSTFRKYKGPIGAAAGLAAAAGASLIPGVGPLVAPVAGKLANDIVQAAGGNSAAQQVVAQAAQQAATDPAAASAFDQAAKAVANATAAYYVKDTAQQAAQGNPAAQQQIVQVATDVENGDPAAKAVTALIASVMNTEWGAKLFGQSAAPATAPVAAPAAAAAGWYDVVGAAIDDVREKARAHAAIKPGTSAGVLVTVDGRLHGRGFRDLDDAVSWLDHITRNNASFTYAAAYEKDAAGTAYIQAEEFGRVPQPPAQAPTPFVRVTPATTGRW